MHSVNAHRIVMLDIDINGRIEERIPGTGQESWLDRTLLGAMYPNIRVALVSVPTEPLDDVEEARVADRLTTVSHNGITYRMVGASGSAKNGKYYYCDIQHEPLIAKRFQQWPEAAITYFGILVSGCKVVHTESKATVMVVRDLVLGTNDCRGWIRKSLFQKLALPEGHFYQFRLAFDSTQAKGSFKVMSDEVADALGIDIVIPDSSIKPGIKMPGAIPSLFGFGAHVYKCPITLGIREVSRPLQFESSYTVFSMRRRSRSKPRSYPRPSRRLRLSRPHGVKAIIARWLSLLASRSTRTIPMENHSNELSRLHCWRMGPGEITRHPYVHAQLSRLMARWAYKLMTGGGVELPAFALADDGFLVLQRGKVMSGADWMPLTAAITSLSSNRGLCVRYPVRMLEDLLPLEHLQGERLAANLIEKFGLDPETAEQVVREQLTLEGTYTLHSETAKRNGGDYDFDWICVIEGDRFPRFVDHRFRLKHEHEVKKDKAEKARSPWFSLEFVALKSRGNQIGVITDLMSSCVAAGRHDLLYELVIQLQQEIDSLKHNTRADRKTLASIRSEVRPAPWLALKEARAINDRELPLSLEVLPTDRIGRLYNILRKHIEELMEKPFPIEQFRGLITGNQVTDRMFEEARLINSVYASWTRLDSKTAHRGEEGT